MNLKEVKQLKMKKYLNYFSSFSRGTIKYPQDLPFSWSKFYFLQDF